jgi:hypothetical protein
VTSLLAELEQAELAQPPWSDLLPGHSIRMPTRWMPAQ